MANSVLLALPVPILRVIGLESDSSPNSVGAVALVLPTPKLVINSTQATDAVTLALPTPVLTITGSVPVPGTVYLTWPAPVLSVTGLVGSVGSVQLALPTPTLFIAGPNSVSLSLPKPVLSSTAVAGTIGGVQFTLPTPTLQVQGAIPYLGTVQLALPTLKLLTGALSGPGARISLALPRLALAVLGLTGTVGSVSLMLPVLKLQASGAELAVGMVRLTLPTLRLYAAGSSKNAFVDGDTAIKAIVMNTQTGALSQYLNYNFNSLAEFNGMYLGANDEGLFLLQGDDDNGALIDAAARLGISDFGTSFRKRIDRCYVGYRADGNMVLRVKTDEAQQRDYLLKRTEGDFLLHGNHTRIGRGVEARYWQFEVRNVAGSDFELNILELKPTRLGRRIGGRDA